MVSFQDVAIVAMGLPSVTEGARYGNRTWFVKDKGFAWERPFSKADIKRYGTEQPPDGPLLAVSVGDLGEKEAILAQGLKGVFTIAHFEGFAAVLIQLKVATKPVVRDLVVDAWLAVAPRALADEYVASTLTKRRPRPKP